MGFFEAVIRALLYICGLMLLFFLVVWALGAIGLALPIMVERIILVMFVLVAILVLARLFYPWVSTARLFPPRNPPGP
jgi:hypothetical protein